ncbi:MAG: DUF4870 domain-containing protein [Candidatus Pacearchaeota archaeon]|jgi:uncharacterized membrane protein
MAKKRDKKTAKSADAGFSKEDETKLFAFLAVFLSIVGFLVAILVKRDDKYVMFYAKQSIILFFAWIIAWVISSVLMFIPFLGAIVNFVLMAFIVILWVFGLIYSLSDKEKELPLIGKYARMISL